MSKNSSISNNSVKRSMQFKCKYGLIVKKFLFQAIQFTQTIQFSISILLVLFNPLSTNELNFNFKKPIRS